MADERSQQSPRSVIDVSAKLSITADALAAIRADARRATPNEVAGILGANASGVVVATVALAEGTPTSVRIRHADESDAAAALAHGRLARAGSYHSHLERDAYPTQADRLAMRVGEPMVIVCTRNDALRAFTLAANRLHTREVAIEVEPDVSL